MCAEGTHAPILLLGGRVFLCVVRPQHLVRQVYFTSIRVLDFIFAEEGSGTPLNHHYDAPETGGSTRRSRTLLAEVQRGSPRNHIQAAQKETRGRKRTLNRKWVHKLNRTRKSMQKKANGERKYALRAPWVFHRPCRAFLGLCGLPSVSLGLVGCETAAHVAKRDHGFRRWNQV